MVYTLKRGSRTFLLYRKIILSVSQLREHEAIIGIRHIKSGTFNFCGKQCCQKRQLTLSNTAVSKAKRSLNVT